MVRGTGLALAWYSQELADAWTSDRTVIEEVESAAPIALVPELRNMLGAFLFRGDDILKPVSVLSGGEKSRLSMLLLLLKPSNLLVLDEPTNHLDIASKDVLLGALAEFPGTVVFVSHDRAFIEGLATSVLEVRDGRARLVQGRLRVLPPQDRRGRGGRGGGHPCPDGRRAGGGSERLRCSSARKRSG